MQGREWERFAWLKSRVVAPLESVKGPEVQGLRGAVLPIVDLAERLGFPPAEGGARQVIIVTQIERQLVGLLVDAVSDILTLPANAVQATPDVAADTVRTFIQGVLALDDRMIGLIKLDSVPPEPQERAA